MSHRYKGYQAELERADIRFDSTLVQYTGEGYHFSNGVKAVHALLSLPDPPTAVFCVSDILALGALRGAIDLGYRVPEDLAVMGFDDVEYATMFKPHITTVRMPCYDLGASSMEVLWGKMNNAPGATRDIVLDFELVIRDST